MRNVTPDELRAAVLAAGIDRIDHHDCGGCGAMVFCSVRDGQLFFNPACDCGGWSPPVPREWSSASGWINMQSDDGVKADLAKSFGIDPATLQQAEV